MMASYREEFNRMLELAELPSFVPWEHMKNDLIPATALSTIIVSVLFVVSIAVVKRIAPKGDTKSTNDNAYLITTLLSNVALGIMGAYYYMKVEEDDPSVDTMVLGTSIIFPMACFQIGKNIWAFPIGFTMFDESPSMLAHHASVILVVTTSVVMTTGFTYFGPILFGLLEWSSIPYAFMTFFKLNPEYIMKYRAIYGYIRISFAVVFLYVRWYLTLPAMWSMLRLVGMRVYTLYGNIQEEPTPFFLLSFTWVATLFLAVLQVFWGVLIIKGMVHAMLKPKKKAKTT